MYRKAAPKHSKGINTYTKPGVNLSRSIDMDDHGGPVGHRTARTCHKLHRSLKSAEEGGQAPKTSRGYFEKLPPFITLATGSHQIYDSSAYTDMHSAQQTMLPYVHIFVILFDSCHPLIEAVKVMAWYLGGKMVFVKHENNIFV